MKCVRDDNCSEGMRDFGECVIWFITDFIAAGWYMAGFYLLAPLEELLIELY